MKFSLNSGSICVSTPGSGRTEVSFHMREASSIRATEHLTPSTENLNPFVTLDFVTEVDGCRATIFLRPSDIPALQDAVNELAGFVKEKA